MRAIPQHRLELTHEKIIGIWIRSSDSEQLHEIVELSVDISADRDGTSLGERAWSASLVSRGSLRRRPFRLRILPPAVRWIPPVGPLEPT